MNATDLISFVSLQDDRGRTHARYYPTEHIVTMRIGGVELAFDLAGAEMKAQRKTPIRARCKGNVSACKVMQNEVE